MSNNSSDKIRRHLEAIKADLKQYIEKKIELMAINVGERSARSLAKLLHKVTGLFFLLGAFFFLLIALALFVGSLLHSRSLGFVLVSAPFLIVGGLFFLLKPRMMTQKLESVMDKKIIQGLDIDQQDNRKQLTSDSQKNFSKHEQR